MKSGKSDRNAGQSEPQNGHTQKKSKMPNLQCDSHEHVTVTDAWQAKVKGRPIYIIKNQI